MGSGDSGSSSKAMSDTKSTRRTYSAEELHRLRGRVSQPRLSEAIEEHDAEDAELVKGKGRNFATCFARAPTPTSLE